MLELVIGLPKNKFEKDNFFVVYVRGMQTHASFHSKYIASTTKPLELLHMDLFGSTKTLTLGGTIYRIL